MTVAPDAALQFVGVSKSFGASRALCDVSWQVTAGTVHALVGENGSGKSTLMRIASGALRPDTGYVLASGQRVAHDPRAARRLGVRIVYQERQIAPELSVAENVLLGQLPAGVVRRRAAEDEARRRLSLLGVELDPRRCAGDLSVAEMQLVELARAMSGGARVLLLDEPTASLHAHEVAALSGVVRRLSGRGLAVVWISHHLHEVFELAGWASVLRDGKIVGSVDVQATTPGEVLRMMFGESVALQRHRGTAALGRERPVAIAAERVSVERSVDEVSMEIRRGEVVALAGAEGSGTHVLAQLLSGAQRAKTGRVVTAVGERPVRTRRDAARRGIGFLPRDRRRAGLLPSRSILENITLARVALGRSLFADNRRLSARARQLAAAIGVKMADTGAAIETLSGGNQQKVMLGRWLDVASSVLVFDEPTAGVDLASRFDIYEQIATLSQKGTAIVIASDDFEEISLVADRVLVMDRGRIVAELAGEDAAPQRLRELIVAGAGVAAKGARDEDR